MEKQTISSYQFPPGVRFHPSDQELIVYYLLNKVNSCPLPAAVIDEVELYNYNPWDFQAPFEDEEWYFFSPRDRKYPNGARPNRTAASGYWKATGTDKPILSSSGARIGVKKALVFYIGKPPNGVKTDWIMIEYRIPDTLIRPSRSKGSMRLDDWVLCRIRKKCNMSKNAWDVPHSPSKLVGNLPNMKGQLPSVNTNTTSDICSTYFLSKDCRLLAKLLATQDFPTISPVTRSTTSQSSNNTGKNSNIVYEHGSSKENDEVINSYFHNSFILQGKPNDESGYGNLSQPIKVIPHLNKNENLLTSNVLAANGSSFYNQHESQGEVFKDKLSNAIMNLQDLDVCAFAERFLH